MEKDFWNIVEKIYGCEVDNSSITSFENDLGFSSFQLVQLIVEVEDFFDIQISNNDLKFELLNDPAKMIEWIKKSLS